MRSDRDNYSIGSSASAAEDSPAADSCGCVRDYGSACPSGWRNNGSSCEAPSSYNGPCLASNNFSVYSAAQKNFAEDRCGVCWCKNTSFLSFPEQVRGHADVNYYF